MNTSKADKNQITKNSDSCTENSKNNDDILYHYTSLNSTRSILESKKLRLSHANYLNDSDEIKLGFTTVKTILETILEQIENVSRLESIILKLSIIFEVNEDNRFKLVKQINEININQLIFKTPFDVFIASFIESSDDLRQWIQYGDDANGCSLGFSKNKLKNLIPRVKGQELEQLTQVRYLTDDEKNNIKKEIEKKVKELDKIKEPKKLDTTPEPEMKEIELLQFQLLQSLISIIVSIKSKHYENEKEWRFFIITPMKKILEETNNILLHFRTSNNTIIPYIVINYCKDNLSILREIKTGPTNDSMSNRYSLNLLTQNERIDTDNNKIILTKSKITSYRRR